uniref:TSA: Wollemia nobilis Ref_Wollemi_Transcript_3752_1321 transcribed RNA sequence n=1 Tax=Wollemia nobilis TaxID=56998 RepID=A0A0C9S8S1_9CONI
MEQRTWPCGSDGRKVPRAFSALHQTPCSSRYHSRHRYEKNVKWEVEEAKRRERLLRRRREGEGAEEERDFAAMPFDVVRRICGSMTTPNLMAASGVCRAWKEALAPLREAALLLHHGKRLKHGRGGVCRNLDKALDSFLKGANRGSAAAMVDAGLLLWEMGRKREGMDFYRAAAELGDPAGQCNLGLSYLQESSNSQEAVKWFYRAAFAGHVRSQYSLALCLQQGRGVERNPVKAAKWYIRAAEGGSTRAMYNTALCYLSGEGIVRNYQEARKWMKRAALAGHRKAQFEHGLTLFAEGDGGYALVFLELATRAGETAATHIRDVLLQQLSPKLRAYAITCADNWQTKQASR